MDRFILYQRDGISTFFVTRNYIAIIIVIRVELKLQHESGGMVLEFLQLRNHSFQLFPVADVPRLIHRHIDVAQTLVGNGEYVGSADRLLIIQHTVAVVAGFVFGRDKTFRCRVLG